MQVTIKFSSLGANLVGPFDLTADVGVVIPAFVLTGAELIAGVVVTVDDAATEITIQSEDVCLKERILMIQPSTTSTSTSTTTSTSSSTTTTTTTIDFCTYVGGSATIII